MCSYIVALEKTNKKIRFFLLGFFHRFLNMCKLQCSQGLKISHPAKNKMPVKNPEKVYFTGF